MYILIKIFEEEFYIAWNEEVTKTVWNLKNNNMHQCIQLTSITVELRNVCIPIFKCSVAFVKKGQPWTKFKFVKLTSSLQKSTYSYKILLRIFQKWMCTIREVQQYSQLSCLNSATMFHLFMLLNLRHFFHKYITSKNKNRP